MPWTKIDDQFYDHPKIVAAGPLGVALFVCSLSYCARHLTDGFITATQAKRLIDVEDPLEVVEQLVAVGLWERRDGGYQVHDYLEYNPSAAQVKAQRAANAERQAKWRGKHEPEITETSESDGNNSNDVNNAVTNTAPIPIPIPDPIPEPASTEPAKTPPAQAPAPAPPTVAPRRKSQKKPPKEPTEKQQSSRAMFSALLELCQFDSKTMLKEQRGQLNKVGGNLREKARASPADITAFREFWYSEDWRGKKGQPPNPFQIQNEWGRFKVWRNGNRRPSNANSTRNRPAGFVGSTATAHDHNDPTPEEITEFQAAVDARGRRKAAASQAAAAPG